MGVKWWGCAKNVILKGIEACRSGEGCRKNGGWETDAGLKTQGYKDGKKIAGLNAHHCKDKEKAAGRAPPRYRDEKKKCRGRREEKSGEGVGGWLDCDESMGRDSMVIYYCQGLLFTRYHSKETGGSCGV